jgi:hypothetical protein
MCGISSEVSGWAVSSRQRNEFGEFLLWHLIAKGFSRYAI